MAEILDIEFDRYGDISFIGNDISMIQDDLDHVYQTAIDRLITNFGDYYLYNSLGANISSYIGQSNTAELETRVVNSVRHTLTYDGFIPPYLLDVVTLRDNQSLLIKIEIGGPGYGIKENIVINSIFNTSSGLLYVTN